MKEYIAVLVPAHNEAQTIGDILSRIPKYIGAYGIFLIVADDCSIDGTAQIAQRYTPHVLALPCNEGVGATTKTGLSYIAKLVGVKYVIKLDGDGQHLPEYIQNVVEELEEGADIVCCSRFHPESDQSSAPLDRVLLNNMFSRQIQEITGWNVSDARTGFMGFRFGDIAAIAHKLIVKRYGIPMEILVRLWHQKPESRLVEIAHPARYENGISSRLDAKYQTEDHSAKAERLKVAYQALLSVLSDLRLTADDILARKQSWVDTQSVRKSEGVRYASR